MRLSFRTPSIEFLPGQLKVLSCTTRKQLAVKELAVVHGIRCGTTKWHYQGLFSCPDHTRSACG
jgi:hypothetical protein